MRSLTRVGSARAAQAVWLVVATAGTTLYAAGPISQWTALQTVCHPDSACQSFQLDPAAARTLTQHGISLVAYGVSTAIALAAVWLLWYGLAALIIWRKPEDRGAVVAAFFLVIFPATEVTLWIPSGVVSSLLVTVFLSLLLIFGLLFPDGHFVPRWIRWLAVAVVVVLGVDSLPLPAVLNGIFSILAIILFVGVIAAPVHRYRSVSSWTERQQTKWGLFGFAVSILGLLGIWLVSSIVPRAGNGSLYSAVDTTGVVIVVSAIPLSIGIAVLRSRLWDIDRVINRALVYTTLTLILAVMYVGGVIALQALFRLVSGSSSGLAIALSTLAIAALFQPLRRWIQKGIDRRFYRTKYDAQRILAAFSEQLQDEVDLTQLSHDLTAVVHDTLHPQHVSLWLRQKKRV